MGSIGGLGALVVKAADVDIVQAFDYSAVDLKTVGIGLMFLYLGIYFFALLFAAVFSCYLLPGKQAAEVAITMRLAGNN